MGKGGVHFNGEALERLKKNPKFSAQVASALRAPVPAADVEQPSRRKPLATYENPPLDTRVRVLVRSFRHRICDEAGISEKAMVDGLVHAGVLTNDTPEEVKIDHEQTQVPKAEEEKTIVELWEIDSTGE